jgi:similar to stage IV sporulation protein
VLFQAMLSFLSGYVKILARGKQLEKLINLATGSGFYLWEICRISDDVLYAKMRAHGFLQIRSIARKSGCTVRICQKKGWPFIARRMRGRKLFFAGGLLFLAGLVYCSAFLWFVKLDGAPIQEKERVLAELYRAGLKPGELRAGLLMKKNLIEREALLRLPQAVWLGINLKGVVAEVKFVPRKSPPPPAGPADVVADSDGLVTKVVVIRGVPLVKEGDTVIRGQMLISGTQWYNHLRTGEMYKEEVTASGIVEARVWNDFEVIEPKLVWGATRGKNRLVRYRLKWRNNRYYLWGFGTKPRGDYFWERSHKEIYRGRNPSEVVELIKDTWEDVLWSRERRSVAAIRTAAYAELERKRKLFGYPPIDLRTVIWSDEGMFLRLRVTVETIRDIARSAPR